MPASPPQKNTRLGYEEIWKLFASASFFPRTSPKATWRGNRGEGGKVERGREMYFLRLLLDATLEMCRTISDASRLQEESGARDNKKRTTSAKFVGSAEKKELRTITDKDSGCCCIYAADSEYLPMPPWST